MLAGVRHLCMYFLSGSAEEMAVARKQEHRDINRILPDVC